MECFGYGVINISDYFVFSGKWCVGGGYDIFDLFVMFGFIVGCIECIWLYVYIFVLFYCNFFLIVKVVVLVDVLLDGWLIIGIGLGYMSLEYVVLGVFFDECGVLMDEVFEVLVFVWGEELVYY